MFKTCQQNLPELPLGRGGAASASSGGAAIASSGGAGTAGSQGTVAIRPAATGGTLSRGGQAGAREDGTPSLADGAGKVPESKLSAPSLGRFEQYPNKKSAFC